MATRVELMPREGEHPELAARIYERFTEFQDRMVAAYEHVTLSATGALDDVVETDEEARALVCALKRELSERLAFGPMPEPYCTVCQAINRPELMDNAVVHALLDYHDAPYRHGPRRPWKLNGPDVYERCMVIYEAAKGLHP
jgi:hypothetical protein